MAENTPGAGRPGSGGRGRGERPPSKRSDETAAAPGRRLAGARKKSVPSKKAAGGGAAAGVTSDAGTPPRKRAPRKPAADAGAAAPAASGASPASGAPASGAAPQAGAPRVLAPLGRALKSRRAPRIRTGVALFLVVASVLAVLVSTLALWSHRIIFDTDAYVRVVAPAAADPEVRRAVSTYVAEKAVQAADLEARIEAALPSDAKVVAPALARALQSYLADEIDGFLRTPLAQRLWADGNRFAHEQLITALQDKNRSVAIGREDVKMDLVPLVAVALQRLDVQIPGLLGRDVTLPPIDPATAPDDVRTLLQDALGRKLPADFASITLLRGSQGYEAKHALRLFNDLVILVVIVTVVLITAALLVAVRRRRTALWLGLGSLLAIVAARIVEVRLEDAAVGAVKTQGGATVARAIVGSAVASLNAFLAWVAVAGAIVAVAALLAGRPQWLDAMSRGFAKLFGVASDLSTPDTGAGRWMAGHLDLLRVAGVAVAIVVLLFVSGSLTAVIVVSLALAVYELALGAYALGVPRQPDESLADADDPGTPPPS